MISHLGGTHPGRGGAHQIPVLQMTGDPERGGDRLALPWRVSDTTQKEYLEKKQVPE
jgi:hypothetical protein